MRLQNIGRKSVYIA